MNLLTSLSLMILVQIPLPQQKMFPQRAQAAARGAIDASKTPVAPPTSPTMIELKFKEQTAAQIALSLNQQTGGLVELQGMMEPTGLENRYTLESEKPVPFWDALDQFSAKTRYQRLTTSGNAFNGTRPHVQLSGPFPIAPNYGPAAYVGAFRVGPVTVHELYYKSFIQPQAVSPTPTLTFYAEIPFLPELNLLASSLGDVEKLEAIDDAGQSLIGTQAKNEQLIITQQFNNNDMQKLIRVSLQRGEKPSTKLLKLRGSLPLEVGRIHNVPSSTIVLEKSSGKTFEDGDLAITINEFRLNEQNQTILKMTLKRNDPKNEKVVKPGALRNNAIWSVFQQEIQIVDAQGQKLNLSGSTSSSVDGTLTMSYLYIPYPFGSKGNPPAQIRVYHAERVKWSLDFEFKDIPLP